MKNLAKIFAFVLVIASVNSAAIADDASQKAADNLVKNNMSGETFKKRFIEGVKAKEAPTLAEFKKKVAAAKPEAPKCVKEYGEWEQKEITIAADKSMDAAKFEKDVAGVYASIFTADEINQLSEFYKTPIGKIILSGDQTAQPSKEQIEAFNTFRKTPVGLKLESKSPEINEKMSKLESINQFFNKYAETYGADMKQYGATCPTLGQYLFQEKTDTTKQQPKTK